MTKKRIVILNGLPLAMGHVGQSIYAQRLAKLLLEILGPNRLRILYPASLSLPDTGLPAVVFERVPCRSASFGGMLSQLATGWAVGRYACSVHPRETFLSPGPFVGPLPQSSIVVLHDVIYRRFPRYEGRFFIRKFMNRLAEWTASRASRVVTVSNFSKQEIVELTGIPDDRVFVLPNWIESDFIQAAEQADLAAIRAKYRLPEIFWLYLGGYDYRKNVEFLIHAYAGASQETTCPPLVLAGKIPSDLSKPYCDVEGAIRTSGVAPDQILKPGFIADADLPGLYRAAALFIFPSLMEGFGFTPAEAIACGSPTLAADNSSLREVVADLAYRFSTVNRSVLTGMLVRAANEPLAVNPTPMDFSSQKSRDSLARVLALKFC